MFKKLVLLGHTVELFLALYQQTDHRPMPIGGTLFLFALNGLGRHLDLYE